MQVINFESHLEWENRDENQRWPARFWNVVLFQLLLRESRQQVGQVPPGRCYWPPLGNQMHRLDSAPAMHNKKIESVRHWCPFSASWKAPGPVFWIWLDPQAAMVSEQFKSSFRAVSEQNLVDWVRVLCLHQAGLMRVLCLHQAGLMRVLELLVLMPSIKSCKLPAHCLSPTCQVKLSASECIWQHNRINSPS